MSGVNKAIIIGRLGRDPELRYTTGGSACCKMNICTSRKYKNGRGVMVEDVEWHRVTAWGDQAEAAAKYLSKGREVYVEGRLHTSSYEKDGQKHYTTEIVVEQMTFLGKRPDTDRREGSPDREEPGGEPGMF